MRMSMPSVYIATPAKAYTGGPTALFQLCNALRRSFNVDSYIAFYNMKSGEDPVHKNYRKFQCPWIPIDKVNDNRDNTLIVPETATYLLPKFRKVKKVIYWLAVDNYILANCLNKKNLGFQFIWFYLKNYPSDIFTTIFRYRHYFRFYLNSFYASYVDDIIKRGTVYIPKADLHIAQSNYAMNFLEKYANINYDNIVLVREPIEEEFLTIGKKIDLKRKRNIVVWNSRKAYPIAPKLVELLKKKFVVVRLDNVGRNNMINILSVSKIFIDIGFHPGRDRPLREAIALGNLVLINDHGGYHFREDSLVPTKFKLQCSLDYLCKINLKEIYENIVLWINDFDQYFKELGEARKYVLLEPKLFIEDIETLISLMI